MPLLGTVSVIVLLLLFFNPKNDSLKYLSFAIPPTFVFGYLNFILVQDKKITMNSQINLSNYKLIKGVKLALENRTKRAFTKSEIDEFSKSEIRNDDCIDELVKTDPNLQSFKKSA